MASVLPSSGLKGDPDNPRSIGISLWVLLFCVPISLIRVGVLGLGRLRVLGLGSPTSFTIGEFCVYFLLISIHMFLICAVFVILTAM